MNVALWQRLHDLPDVQGWRGLAFALVMGVMMACALAGLLSLLSWRFVYKPLIITLLLAASAGAYFMLTYRVVIDRTMMVNVFQTDWREARDLLHPRLIGFLVVLGVLPSWLVWRRPLLIRPPLAQFGRNLAAAVGSMLVLGLALFLFFQDFSALMRNHKDVRYLLNPLNSLYALGKAGAGESSRRDLPLLPIGADARLGAAHAAGGKPPLMLLVIGETARSANFSLNGYPRLTNPALMREDVASFRRVESCGTSTAVSLPCMFSHLGSKESSGRHENLLDVLQRAGLAVLWVDNQSGCKGLCDRVSQVTAAELQVPGLCDGGECLDEVMLRGLQERIASLDPVRSARGVVVVLHQMGSHGPAYYKRSPPEGKVFLPECNTSALQQCDRNEIVNAYDNSIVYTDRFLAKAIAWLRGQQRYESAMLYVSDHGESLGENNLYLHGMPFALAPDEQKQVPMIAWLSPQAQSRSGVTIQCLQRQVDKPLSHDNLFHSVLGWMDVQTSVYQADLDFYAACART